MSKALAQCGDEGHELVSMLKDIIPFSLINHLLFQFKLRHSSNDLTPIVLLQDCDGMCLLLLLVYYLDNCGISAYFIAGLSGVVSQKTSITQQGTVESYLDSIVAMLKSYILPRNPIYFCYSCVIQPCTFVDSFSYVYEVK